VTHGSCTSTSRFPGQTRKAFLGQLFRWSSRKKALGTWRLEGGIPPAVTGGHHLFEGRAGSFASQTTLQFGFNVCALPE